MGLVINTTAPVGAMLEHTGKDEGSDKKKTFENAEVIEFCSAKVSRAVMEADPRAKQVAALIEGTVKEAAK